MLKFIIITINNGYNKKFNNTYLINESFMDPFIGMILLAIYPIVLVGALILFAKFSKNPE